jgi:hypothetical protein
MSLHFGRGRASNPRPRVDIVFLPFQHAFFFTHDALRGVVKAGQNREICGTHRAQNSDNNLSDTRDRTVGRLHIFLGADQ